MKLKLETTMTINLSMTMTDDEARTLMDTIDNIDTHLTNAISAGIFDALNAGGGSLINKEAWAMYAKPVNEFVVLMLPSMMPLNYGLQSIAACNSDIAWQVRGSSKASEFEICRLIDGKLYTVKDGEERTPTKGCYTEQAWAELQSIYANHKADA